MASTSKNHNNKTKKNGWLCFGSHSLSLCREFSFGIFWLLRRDPTISPGNAPAYHFVGEWLTISPRLRKTRRKPNADSRSQRRRTRRGAATHVYGPNEINNKMEEKEERREQATICFVGRFRLPGPRLCLRVWNVDVFNKPKRSLISAADAFYADLAFKCKNGRTQRAP